MYAEFMENAVIWVNFLLCNVNTILVARDRIIANLKHAHLNTIKFTACIILKKIISQELRMVASKMSFYYTSNYLKSVYTLTTKKYRIFSHNKFHECTSAPTCAHITQMLR